MTWKLTPTALAIGTTGLTLKWAMVAGSTIHATLRDQTSGFYEVGYGYYLWTCPSSIPDGYAGAVVFYTNTIGADIDFSNVTVCGVGGLGVSDETLAKMGVTGTGLTGIGAGIMIPIAPATTSVPTGSAWTTILDQTTGAAKVAQLAIDVQAPSTADVTVRVCVRVAASGRLIPIPAWRLGAEGVGQQLDGVNPVPASTSAAFIYNLPAACDSVVVQAKHGYSGAADVVVSGSLA